MKVIIGLGNPGSKYKNNRHNVGYIVVDTMKVRPSEAICQGLTLLKSDKFMNESGSFVLSLTKTYNLLPNDLFIVHDDLDIPLGSFKVQFGKGPKDHNGLNDIYDKLDTNKFWHVRVGIDWRDEKGKMRKKGKEYVLEDFTKEEKKILNTVIKKICFELIDKLKIKN